MDLIRRSGAVSHKRDPRRLDSDPNRCEAVESIGDIRRSVDRAKSSANAKSNWNASREGPPWSATNTGSPGAGPSSLTTSTEDPVPTRNAEDHHDDLQWIPDGDILDEIAGIPERFHAIYEFFGKRRKVGFEFAKIRRHKPRLSNVPVHPVTGANPPQDPMTLQNTGAFPPSRPDMTDRIIERGRLRIAEASGHVLFGSLYSQVCPTGW